MSLADIRIEKFCLVYCGERCDCQAARVLGDEVFPPAQGDADCNPRPNEPLYETTTH